MALKSDGTVWAWGANARGQLGDGTTSPHPIPTQVAGLTGVTAVSASRDTSHAISADGRLWTWGRNDYGQLGVGTTTDSTRPVAGALTDVVAVDGYWHTVALRGYGSVWAWGLGSSGQVATVPSTRAPTRLKWSASPT